MNFRWQRLALVLALVGIAVSLGFFFKHDADTAKPAKVRLAVLVVFDQMRGDYPAKWKDLFAKGGFRRMQNEGVWFNNCHYPYAFTVTSAGHASLATGTSAYRHGIVGNEWFDRTLGVRIASTDSDRHRIVPAVIPSDGAPAPVHRRAPSIGDALLDTHKGKSKVVSLSIKDTAAVMLSALRGLCFWFTYSGMFVTSTHYAETLPAWVNDFNKEKNADQWFGKDWTRFGDFDYAKYSDKDDNPFEGIGYKQGRTFPHPTTGGADKVSREYYKAMTTSAYGNELLLSFAKRAIVGEKLGQRDAPDLLCLSFSSNDYVGHCWGPDSQEVLDITLRSDRIIHELLEFLDDKVGKGNYILAVSADHGVCPIPEIAKAQGKDAGRIAPALFTTQAEAFLDATFGANNEKLPWIASAGGEGVFLNRGVLKERNLDQAKVERALADWFVKQHGIKLAYTRTELSKGPLEDAVGETVRRSFHPDRSGDVVTIIAPYWQVSGPLTAARQDAYRTSHGTPWEYDTHVPLLVYGPGLRAGIRDDRIAPQSVAVILAEALGVPSPAQAEHSTPKDFWR